MPRIAVILAMVFITAGTSFGQGRLISSAKGQMNGWSLFNFGEEIQLQLGARFIPAINLNFPIDTTRKLDAEISFNTTSALLYKDWKQSADYERFDPYRLWLRYSSKRFEIRAGLQKINFGSASMLRPLMWFDQIDPRDPLQLTNGVYGILGRYYFKNYANIWLWTLYGNDKPKGWDMISSSTDLPEYGGRFQFPVPKGEAAISLHARTANLNSFFPDSLLNGNVSYPETRLGFDGKWDLVAGVWFEYMFLQSDINGQPRPKNYQHALNLGLDYTFGIGNGLTAMTEFFWFAASDDAFQSLTGIEFSALSVSYPISVMDNISAILYYNWVNNSWYRFINIQRTYDVWSFYLMAFWNPDQFDLYNINMENNLFAGKGLQLMCVYNF